MRIIAFICIFVGLASSANACPGLAEQMAINIKVEKIKITRALPALPNMTFEGAYELSADHKAFGGLSGLLINDQGQVTAISDCGYWLQTTLNLSEKGPVFLNSQMAPMRNKKGRRLKGRAVDAESMTLDADGQILVGFERQDRIRSYNPSELPSGKAKKVTFETPKNSDLDFNKGLEAMTSRPDGQILAFAEGDEHKRGLTQGWIMGGDELRQFDLPVTDFFRPTDLIHFPEAIWAENNNGGYLLLERYYKERISKMRLRYFSEEDINRLIKGHRLTGRTIPLSRHVFPVDNMEALALYQNGQANRLLMLSDDNFSDDQRTIMLIFRLED